MADNTQGGTHAQHVNAGQQSSGNSNADQNLTDEDRSKGGKASHQNGAAHEFDSDEAREAGRKGGSK